MAYARPETICHNIGCVKGCCGSPPGLLRRLAMTTVYPSDGISGDNTNKQSKVSENVSENVSVGGV